MGCGGGGVGGGGLGGAAWVFQGVSVYYIKNVQHSLSRDFDNAALKTNLVEILFPEKKNSLSVLPKNT